MSDLGDMSRLFTRVGIEHDIMGRWFPSSMTYAKILTIMDPAGPDNSTGREHGVDFYFDPESGAFLGMNMFWQQPKES